MTEATVEATENLPQEAPTEIVEEKVSDLPTDDKPEDEAKPEGEAKEDKPEPTEADKIKYAMQKRIDRQTAKAAETERLLREAQTELSKYRIPEKSGAPREEDYPPEKGGYEAYLKAQGAYEYEQKQKTEAQAKAQAEADALYQRQIAERKQLFEKREIELKATLPDYDEKVAEVEDVISSMTDSQKSTVEFQVFRDMLFSSDVMPEITYELGKSPDLFDKLMAMNPLQIARTIAKLELQIENAPKQQHKPVTAPPSPISSGSKANKSVNEMSYKELKKQWKL